ncbi:hypothetical protein [Streptomyces sp. TLI_185]|uniref:hypothetical protein n=1 Tax=Streptomyces sp. TLI_185 TaxID=2485151 RepID=UPI000F4F7C4A|nr:hypothetical protein [Streptomyces sp. TLI_185]RPF38755.1 hypothetical protein EDD92_8923 [Streptomyces sp. TLI_185]
MRRHGYCWRAEPAQLVADAGLPGAPAGQLLLPAEGTMATAGITQNTEPAREARAAAQLRLAR